MRPDKVLGALIRERAGQGFYGIKNSTTREPSLPTG